MDSSAAPSTSATCTSSEASDTLKIGLQSLAAGKRHLLTKDVQMALPALEEACKLLDQVRGTFSQESGEAHFYYGRALLEQSRIESGLFEGCAVGGVIGPEDYEEDVEDEEEEEEDEDPEEDEEAPELVAVAEEKEGENRNGGEKESQAENGAGAESTGNGVQSTNGNGKADKDMETEVANENGGNNQENVPPKSPVHSTASSVSGSEPTNLEIAWEVLEVAKLSFTRQLDTATTQEQMNNIKKRLAEVHVVLGEVANESEQYPQAVQDFETAIGLYESMDDGGDKREVAQCLFQIGLAYVYWKKFADGIVAFKRAKSLIEARIAEVPAESQDAAELRELLPELEEKIQDTEETERDEQAERERNRLAAEEGAGELGPAAAAADGVAPPTGAAAAATTTNGTSTIVDKPANDISHLIRRKPAPVPAEVVPAPDATDGVAVAEQQQPKRKLDEEELADATPLVVEQPPEKKQCTQ